MRRWGTARTVAVALAAAVAASCTTTPPEDAPSPTSSPTAAPVTPVRDGDRVTVIVPPETLVAPAEGNALARAATELAAAPPEGVAQVRVVQAVSDAFTRDLAELAVDDGHDLVCIVGTGAAALVLELARARRDGRFCTTDVNVAGGPVNIVAVGVDPAALVEAGAVAVGTAPAPVGLLLVEQLGDQEALGSRFTATVPVPRQPSPAAGVGPSAAPNPLPSPAPAPAGPGPSASPTAPAPTTPMPSFAVVTAGTGGAAQVAAAEQLADQRPSRAVVLAPLGGSAAAAAAARTGAELVVVSDWAVDAEGELPSGLLVALTVDWAQLLQSAITAARAPDPPQVQALGVADGVLGALPGTAANATAAADRTTAHLRRAAEAAAGRDADAG